ncbi:MAG: electron transfer flavoprotein subunit beta/FixA family protein [Planctomycetota bacterium]
MAYKIVVCAKQVPDTREISGDAMKADGTLNRAALPAIFNPEDKNALEMGLGLRDRFGGMVTVITMGPPRAADILRESLEMGADHVVLLTDRGFAVADTLATSYTLGRAIERAGGADVVLCGRQAIDGDTAQIGPQLAGRLGIAQATYVTEVVSLGDGVARVKRMIEGGVEVVDCRLPVLMTIPDAANEPRPPRAKLVMKYKHARAPWELAREVDPEGEMPDDELARKLGEIEYELAQKDLLIAEWDGAAIAADMERTGYLGSPTRVMKIEPALLKKTEHKRVEPTEEGLSDLVHELAEDHVLG